MIQANIDILRSRLKTEFEHARHMWRVLNEFESVQSIIENPEADGGWNGNMTAAQKQAALAALTFHNDNLAPARAAVDEAFTATKPLPPDPEE